MGDRLDGLVNLSSAYARQQFSHSRPSLTTCPGTRLGECGREEEERGAVLYFTPYKPCELLPSADCAARGTKLSTRVSLALVGRGMLFIQFGAGGRGREVFLALMPTAQVTVRAGPPGNSANLPSPCLAILTHLLQRSLPVI